MYTALTIAGSDPSGGAGIQADIKTMTALGVYAQSCITSLTAQNTTGVFDVMEVNEKFLKSQLECVFNDIYPDAVKIGMVPGASQMRVIANCLKSYTTGRLVVDPVMISTSGRKLMDDDTIDILKKEILTLKGVVTPNIPEAEVLIGRTIYGKNDVEKAAMAIYDTYGCAVLIKGGHATDKETSDDYLYSKDISRWYINERIDNDNTHGTGCTLSSAIASYLAMGYELDIAVKKAKEYLTGAIKAGLNLGKGIGPLNHAYKII